MNIMKYLGVDIDLEDRITWDYLCGARNLKGLFQLETRSASIVLRKIQPRSIRDLSICNSLNRPGASSFTNEVSDIKNNDKLVTYAHPDLEPILNETYGKFIYQEQLMKCAQRMANFTAKESNALLKAMGKKKKDLMQAQKEAFISGMMKNKYDKGLAEHLFKELEAFADYGFNASHSYSYSLLGFASAFIKTHHPLQFFTSLLNYSEYEQNATDEIFDIVAETRHFGIDVLPPSVDRIVNKFEIVNGKIAFPIGKLRNVGDSIFEKMKTLAVAQTQSLDAFLEAVLNVGINSRSVEAIIISGALDKFAQREDILFYFWFVTELTDKSLQNFWHFKNGRPFSRELIQEFVNYREIKQKGKLKQADFDFTTSPGVTDATTGTAAPKISYKSHFHTESTRLKAVEKVKQLIEKVDFYKKNTKMARFFWENYVLGYSYTHNLEANLRTFKDITDEECGEFNSCGFVKEVQARISKKKNPIGIFTLKFDETADFITFGETWERVKDVIKEDDFVVVKISKDENGSRIEQIQNRTSEKQKYEFYVKHEIGK